RGNITFFIPFNLSESNNPVFSVLRKTYEPYVPLEKWTSIYEDTQQHNVVQKLSRNIFTNNIVQVDDRTVEFVEFETHEDEMNAIVERAAAYIKQSITSAEKL